MTESRGTVLAVDDDPGALSALADALGTLGFEVVQAADGATALELAHEQPARCRPARCPDARDGRIRGLSPTQGRSGSCSWSRWFFSPDTDRGRARLEGLEAGATDFLNKPCDLVELEVRVRNLVNFRRLTTELDSAEQMVFSIARVVEARDQDTGDHCERLARLSVGLGERIGLDGEHITALRRGGYLHDLGKIGIPDEVLLKPGKLTADEWTVMKRHVEIGVEICSPLRSLQPVLPLIRHHHERFDGSGYPDGLSGEEIPLLARVFQVVDVYDALTVDRCYRAAMSVDEAVAVVKDETEKGFWDREIVDEFLTMLDEGVDPRPS